MNDFLKHIIEEAFKSKKQQRYFYAKAGDESLPKKERTKWGKWSKEFSDKTNFKKLPEVAEENTIKDSPTMLKLIKTAEKDGHLTGMEGSANYVMHAAKQIAKEWDDLKPEERKVFRDSYYEKFLRKIHKKINEDYKVIDTKHPDFNPESLFYYEAIAFIDVKKRIKENLDSFQEVQEFANKMAHTKHAEALQIHKFNDTGLVKKSYFIYNQDEDKWEKVKSLPYHEFHKPEGEIEEIVDELGNIARSKIPTNAETKGTTSKETTDDSVKKGHGQTGVYGTHGAQTYSRYWGESDMSKTLGFEATLKQDASREEAEEYFKKDLEMSDAETEERLSDMGYDKDLPDDKVRLVENPRKFIEEYIESILSKKSNEGDLVSKEKDLTEINPIVLKQIKSLKNSLESNDISIQDLIKLLKDNE